MNDTSPKQPADLWSRLKSDILASIVVFLVALPLCMGIAIASGAPSAAVGMITGVVGGIVVGIFSGSPFQVSGPAAGLIVVVATLAQNHRWNEVGLIILLAGMMQLAAGIFRFGQWFRAVSPAVIHGMLAGIGILIFASQFHMMVDETPAGNGIANLRTAPESFWKGVIVTDVWTHDDAGRIGLLTIIVLVLWKPVVPKRFKAIPPALVAVIVASVAAAWFNVQVKFIEVPDSLFEAIRPPAFSTFLDVNALIPLLLPALSIALIASAESLLCAGAVDKLHSGPRTRYDRELAAQGIGNMVSGLLGGLPITGVIVRSAANVEAGAKTRLSAILHGVWLLVFVLFCPFLLRMVPMCSLAALLVYTGIKLINIGVVKQLQKYGKSEVFVYFATMIAIVVTDLLTGVLVGVGLSMAKLLITFAHLKVRIVEDSETQRTYLHLHGAATFLRLPKLAAVLESIRPNTELHVMFEELTHIDHACLELLMSWELQHEATGGSLEIDWSGLHARFQHFPRRLAPSANGELRKRPTADVSERSASDAPQV